ncbi:MAG: tRNA glutamyl-Q(34) synthetase GluQRS [Pseudomonadota bacterium]|nr:MAG: tRNA glutamyl-Q(34) synthetase GluQRS [Pseudomonadota bacterium]
MVPEVASGRTARPTGVGRLAPSPTGLLHLGHARTFLVAWWWSRSQGGRVLLRIEDLDGDRASPEFVDAAREDLAWLGLDWDGPPILQSTGVSRMGDVVDRLLRAGLAYPCTCSRADIRNAASAPQVGVTEVRYPGTCRDRFASLEEAERATGRSPGVRLRVPEGRVRFDDAVFGPQSVDVAQEVGDFLIARRNGAPAYQLAVVLDDADQGVTDIVRGADLLPSTARQFLIQEALGLPHPTWAHVPLVLDASGRRLAKREDALSLRELRARGADPRAIVAWAARTAGFTVPERVTAEEVLPVFDRSRLSRAPVTLDARQLAAFCC